MSSRKSAAVAVDLAVLESSAIAAVRSIESGYSAASKAIMAYVLGAKTANATPPMFDAGIARISDAIPGVAKITVGAYISNARRIFAADAASLVKAKKEAGTDSIKALAAACPVVSKAKSDGQNKKAADKAATAPTAPAVVVSTPATDPMLALNNSLVMLRKLAAGKKKAKLILAAIGEIEDMMQDIKDMLAA